MIDGDRVKGIFNDALEVGLAEREEFVAAVCGADLGLHSEVVSLLKSYDRVEDFLDSPAIGLSAGELAEQILETEEASAVGKLVGAYRIERAIGRGGMGSVYLATRSDKAFTKQVAIKLLLRGTENDALVRRFEKERQIIADLEHPNIARLIDGGTTENNIPYFVMEFVAGLPVDKYCDERGLSIRDRLTLFLDICSAVAYAHSHSIIHRDIKPGNILINEMGSPKLLDFGIAKSHADAGNPASTATAFRVMTPEYASPEQMRGDPIGNASDIYSLGVLLYQIITGRRPYDLEKRSPVEIVQAICENQPLPPSSVKAVFEDSKSLHLTIDLDRIVLKSLRKDPERRYASVKELSDDILRLLEGKPIAARDETIFYRWAKFSRRFAKRNRTAVISTVVTALMFLVIGSFLTSFSTRNEPRNSVAVLPFANSDDRNLDYLSDGVANGLIDNLSKVGGISVRSYNSVLSYKVDATNVNLAGRTLGVETVLTGSIVADGKNILIEAALYDVTTGQRIWSRDYRGQSSDVQVIQHELSADVIRELGFESANEQRRSERDNTTNAEAYELYLRGQHFWEQRTGASLDRAAEYFQRAIDIDPEFGLAHVGLANTWILIGAYQFLPPDETFSKAKLEVAKALRIDPSSADAHNSLAFIAWKYDWDWAVADREFNEAIRLNPNFALAHHWYGLFLGEQGRSDQAIVEERRALEIDPFSTPTMGDLARVYYYAQRYDDAFEQLRKAEKLGPPGVEEIAPIYVYLYQQTGSIDQLINETGDFTLKKALKEGGMKAYWQRLLELELDKKPTWTSIVWRAQLYARVGRSSQAIEQLELAYRAHVHPMTGIKVDLSFYNIRLDPRFVALLKRMHLD